MPVMVLLWNPFTGGVSDSMNAKPVYGSLGVVQMPERSTRGRSSPGNVDATLADTVIVALPSSMVGGRPGNRTIVVMA